jgi:2-amino-4-hydroxy-6-hydroxymethyldihydropteridine diphosphokinase
MFLLLGSNLGDRLANLDEAKRQLGNVVASSSVYETAAWGNTNQGSFLNQVVQIDSKLSPENLLKRIQDIETSMGRKRLEKWGPRLIDIDILFYGNQIINSDNLIVPHPEIQNRRFALTPLAEIAPSFLHPVLKKTISTLLKECKDPLPVTRLQH